MSCALGLGSSPWREKVFLERWRRELPFTECFLCARSFIPQESQVNVVSCTRESNPEVLVLMTCREGRLEWEKESNRLQLEKN